MNTDRDYSNMVNPYARMEDEAERRGFWRGVEATLYGLVIVVILAGIAFLP